MAGDDRYEELLGVAAPPVGEPTYYELLGLKPGGAPSADALEQAFKEKMSRLQQSRSQKHKGFVEYLKEELRHAKLTLSSEERRAEYDEAIKARKIAAVRELIVPVVESNTLPPAALAAFVAGVAAKHGLDPADALQVLTEATGDGSSDDAVVEEPEEGGRTLASRKLKGAERHAPAELHLGDLVRILRQQGEAAYLKRFDAPILLEDERGWLGGPEALKHRAELEQLSIFTLRRRDRSRGEVTVGRGQSVDVRLDIPSVSSRHASFHPPDAGKTRWKVTDNVSTNGTFLEGKRLAAGKDAELLPVSRIVFGASRLFTFYEPGLLMAQLRPLAGTIAPSAAARPAPKSAPAPKPVAPPPAASRPAPKSGPAPKPVPAAPTFAKAPPRPAPAPPPMPTPKPAPAPARPVEPAVPSIIIPPRPPAPPDAPMFGKPPATKKHPPQQPPKKGETKRRPRPKGETRRNQRPR